MITFRIDNGFGIKEMVELVLCHTLAGVFDGDFHTVVKIAGRDGDAAVLGCEFTGVVGQRVEHEEGEHLVGLDDGLRGLYLKIDTLHLERRASAPQQVEERLEREALDMQAEISLTQLYPVGEHLVVVVDLVSQLTDIVHRLLTPYSFSPSLLLSYFMYDAVDEGRDAVDERDFRPLFEAEPLAVLHPQTLYSQLFALLFEEVVGDVLTAFAAVHVVEEPEREEQQDDGDDDGNQHKVQLPGSLLILAGTGLELTVLTSGLLQVEVEVAVVVALRLVVDGGIGHAELFADGSHEVGGLIDERVGECLFEVVERRFVVADLSETGCESTVGTGNLVDVAILFEDVQRVLCEPA